MSVGVVHKCVDRDADWVRQAHQIVCNFDEARDLMPEHLQGLRERESWKRKSEALHAAYEDGEYEAICDQVRYKRGAVVEALSRLVSLRTMSHDAVNKEALPNQGPNPVCEPHPQVCGSEALKEEDSLNDLAHGLLLILLGSYNELRIAEEKVFRTPEFKSLYLCDLEEMQSLEGKLRAAQAVASETLAMVRFLGKGVGPLSDTHP